jgi:hypothetical protein
LLKQWLQTGKTVDWLRDEYMRAMTAMHARLWGESVPGKLAFVGELLADGQQFRPKMVWCFHVEIKILLEKIVGILPGIFGNIL